MRTQLLLLASVAGLAACAPVAEPATASNTTCGTYGYIDVNNDGFITGDEWNTYRTNAYGFWDVNKDGRIDRAEFENCWRGGGFYRDAYYNPDDWSNYWTAFDANGDLNGKAARLFRRVAFTGSLIQLARGSRLHPEASQICAVAWRYAASA